MKAPLLNLDSHPILDIVRRYVSEIYYCNSMFHANYGGGNQFEGNGRFRPIPHQ